MVVERGQIWWVDLGEPIGSEPGFRRPILIVQSDAFNRSRLRTVLAVVLTSNLRLVDAPGNVLIPAKVALREHSVSRKQQSLLPRQPNQSTLRDRATLFHSLNMRSYKKSMRADFLFWRLYRLTK